MFVRIEKNIDGSHTFQSGGIMEEGWAVVPREMPIPNSFPFVNIEVAEVNHPAITDDDGNVLEAEYIQLEVVSMTEGEEIIFEEIISPSQLDIIEAQVAYTAMMTDTLLEV